jgi:hypothetical protein
VPSGALRQLIGQLIEHTETGGIDWRKESGYRDSFETDLANRWIQIQRGLEESQEASFYVYSMQIRDDEECIFDEVQAAEPGYKSAIDDVGYLTKLVVLFDVARRSAMGSDQAIEQMLGKLNQHSEHAEEGCCSNGLLADTV